MRDQVNNEVFKQAYNSLPKGIYLEVKKELVEKLGWSQSLLYMRLSGARSIKESEIPVIKQIFEKYGFKVFTDVESKKE